MKPTAKSSPKPPAGLLAFGAHPDDIEFGCGAVLAQEAQAGRPVHLVVCSRGEAASRGTPRQRVAEAKKAAALLGATLEFVALDGDARLEHRPAHVRALAAIIRRERPATVLAPTLAENQHPDHFRLGRIVREAARFARYGGIGELRRLPPHAIEHLLFYAVTAEAEPAGALPILIDVSRPAVLGAWRQAMAAHGTQAGTRPYAELQLARARAFGLRAGVAHAQALFPNDPLCFPTLAQLSRSARQF